ncbi:hypothetical protein FF1_013728 [Malus domestica]
MEYTTGRTRAHSASIVTVFIELPLYWQPLLLLKMEQHQQQQLWDEISRLSSSPPYSRLGELKPTNLEDTLRSFDPSLLSRLQAHTQKPSTPCPPPNYTAHVSTTHKIQAHFSLNSAATKTKSYKSREREKEEVAGQFQKTSMYIEHNPAIIENGDFRKNVDDDGRPKRTGTWITATAHIITAVIGSGVLSLAWAIAQLGWVAGPAVLMAFSFITYFTSIMHLD